MSAAIALQFRSALVTAAIVIALYVFIGNSGVLSFGQVSFVALGAFAAGLVSVPEALKLLGQPGAVRVHRERAGRQLRCRSSSRRRSAASSPSSFGVPLMRLSGPRRRHRHVRRARDHAQRAAELAEDRPGSEDALARSRDDHASGRRRRRGRGVRDRVRLPAQPLRAACCAPPARSRPPRTGSGINIHRQRLVAFTISGALAGFAGGLLVHLLGWITTEQVYLDLTFITLAMLDHRRRREPLGRGRRRAARQRPQLAPERGRERHRLRRPADRARASSRSAR